MPQTRKKFWKEKIERNKQRDRDVNKHYKKEDWKSFRIWEHKIKKNSDRSIAKIIKLLKTKRFK